MPTLSRRGKSAPKSKTAKPSTFDPSGIAQLIPGEVANQVDVVGRPLKIGDRVDDVTEYVGGVVVAIFGGALIFISDYDSGYGMGRFVYQNCNQTRLLPIPTDAEAYAKEVLAYRDFLESDGPIIPKDSQRPKATVLTRLCPDAAKCADGPLIELGDLIKDFGYDATGIVVGIAGNALLIQTGPTSFDHAYASQSDIMAKRADLTKGGAK